MKELPLCKCGCGKQVERATKTYFGDHYRNPPKMKIEIVDKSISEPVPIDAPLTIIMSEIEPKPLKIEKTEKIFKCEMGKDTGKSIKLSPKKPLKAKTTPIPGGKISKANLRNVGLGIYTQC